MPENPEHERRAAAQRVQSEGRFRETVKEDIRTVFREEFTQFFEQIGLNVWDNEGREKARKDFQWLRVEREAKDTRAKETSKAIRTALFAGLVGLAIPVILWFVTQHSGIH